MKRHPARYELFAYAESLAGQASPISARVAGHVARCPACMDEVAGMRATLEFLANTPDLEPSAELTSAILMGAQTARVIAQSRKRRMSTLAAAAKGFACAAGIVLAAAVYFSVALPGGTPNSPALRVPPASMLTKKPAAPNGPAMRDIGEEVRALASAVNTPAKTPPSVWERERRRALVALERDIAAALAALERNPGCTRAANLVTANLQRQADALRALYLERSL